MRSPRALVRGLDAGLVPLSPEASRYLVRVHRLADGASFVAFDGAGREGQATLAMVEGRAHARVASVAAAPVRREVTWMQALGKGDKTDAVVRDATELGASRVIIVVTERTVPRLGDKAASRLARWRTIAEEAARQSLRADVPEVEGPVPFAEAIRAFAAETSVLLHPGGDVHARDALREGASSLALVAGPEGGFSDDEVGRAAADDYAVATLGPTVLRTETACAAVLGALLLLR